MIYFYKHLTNLLYPIIIIFIYCRKLINKEDPNRYKEKLFSSHFNIKRKKNLKLIWFHAASIGEVKSILPIIHELNSHKSSLEQINNKSGNDEQENTNGHRYITTR